MRNTLYKAYLDDFASFCEKLGGTTSEVMSDLLAFEADRRALNITLNRCAPTLVPKPQPSELCVPLCSHSAKHYGLAAYCWLCCSLLLFLLPLAASAPS